MTYKVYQQKAQSSIHFKVVNFIQDLIQEETTKFMDTWTGKYVSINDGGYYHSGTIVECKLFYTHGNGELQYKVTLVDYNGEIFYLYAKEITELTEQQYALVCLKKQLQSIPWSETNENELYNLKEFADKLDISDIIAITKKDETTN